VGQRLSVGNLVRIWWLRATTCLDYWIVQQPNERGHYPVRFCDRWTGHRGEHRDSTTGAAWPRDAL